MIVAVAIHKNGLLFTKPAPARHHDVISEMACQGIDAAGAEQGFLRSDGKFLTRIGALAYAYDNDQLLKRDEPGYTGYQGPELFSEDLW